MGGCVTTGTGSKALAGPGDGVVVEGASDIRKLVPAEQLERSATKQFEAMKREAQKKNALLPPSDPTVVRLNAIANRLKPYANAWNPGAPKWNWEVAVFKNDQINAFCMPGGKIGFFTGIVDKLKLTDDEIAMVMGHEMAHALREHSRAQLAKAQLADIGATVLSSLMGLGEGGRQVMGFGTQLLTMKFSRSDETDADLVGLDIASRAGYDPRTAIVLWRKMQSDPVLMERYEIVRNARALANAERIEALAEKVETEQMDPNAAKVAMGARQWLAERMDPKRWGNKIQQDVKITDTTQLHLEAVRNLMRTVSVVEPEKLTADTDAPSDADARDSSV